MKDLVVIENDRPGLLATISTALARDGVNITRLSALAAINTAVINLGVSDPQRAVRILKENNFTVLEEEALIISLQDKPGTLSEVTQKLKDANINMKSAYIVGRSNNTVYLAISVDNYQAAVTALASHLSQPLNKE